MPAVRPAREPVDGRFIRLTPLVVADLPELAEAILHEKVFAGGFGGGAAGFEKARAGFDQWAAKYYQWDAGNVYGIRVIGGSDDGALVGASTLGDFSESREHAHIGWTAYNPRVWATAVNPEAKLLLLSLAFDHGFGRVKIQADARNTRSRAAILRLGATFEGIVRRDSRRPDGSWRDTAVYSVIVDEWPQVRAGLQARLEAWGGEPVTRR